MITLDRCCFSKLFFLEWEKNLVRGGKILSLNQNCSLELLNDFYFFLIILFRLSLFLNVQKSHSWGIYFKQNRKNENQWHVGNGHTLGIAPWPPPKSLGHFLWRRIGRTVPWCLRRPGCDRPETTTPSPASPQTRLRSCSPAYQSQRSRWISEEE